MTEHVISFTVRTNVALTNDDMYGLRQAIEDSAPLGPKGIFEVTNIKIEKSEVLPL